MDWDYAIYRFRLAHIFALLFSLAEIAELAAVASPRRRRELIFILLRGEAAGLRALELSDVADADVSLDGMSCDPDDALRLAVSLRALAIWLYILERLGDPLFDRETAHPEDTLAERKADLLLANIPHREPEQEVPLIDTS